MANHASSLSEKKLIFAQGLGYQGIEKLAFLVINYKDRRLFPYLRRGCLKPKTKPGRRFHPTIIAYL